MGQTNRGGRSKTIPGRHEVQIRVPIIALGTSESWPLFFNNTGKKIRVKKLTFVADDDHTGADTNNQALGATNRGTDGSGAVVVAPAKPYASGVDLGEYEADDIPITTTEADAEIADLEVVSFDKTETGSGLASVAGLVVLEFEYL